MVLVRGACAAWLRAEDCEKLQQEESSNGDERKGKDAWARGDPGTVRSVGGGLLTRSLYSTVMVPFVILLLFGRLGFLLFLAGSRAGSSRQLDAELYTPAFAPIAQLLIRVPRASPAGQPLTPLGISCPHLKHPCLKATSILSSSLQIRTIWAGTFYFSLFGSHHKKYLTLPSNHLELV